MFDEPEEIVEKGVVSSGNNYGSVDFSRRLGALPAWLDLDEEPLLTPGAIEQDEETQFFEDIPRDAYTDDATQRVIMFSPDTNPTKVVGREYLLADKSDLINDASTLLKDVLSSLRPVVFAQQPVLERIIAENVRDDGHIEDGRVIWTIEVSASNQPNINWSRQSTPTRRSRIEVPMRVKEGKLVTPLVFTNASNKMYPLTIEGCQLALHWRHEPVSRSRPPRVERSWAEERDYRAF